MKNPSLHTIAQAAVYVLQRKDRSRIKVGWALRPLARIAQLPEFGSRKLDIPASRTIWLPSRERAEQIERSMHKSLRPFAVVAEHRGDGCTEWFSAAAHDMALRMLGQMPVSERTHQLARVVPLRAPPPAPDAVSIETSPQDTWSGIEDVWTRLAVHLPISVENVGQLQRVVIHDFRTFNHGGALRMAAVDADTYQCRNGSGLYPFVDSLSYRGDDLVIDMKHGARIERWPEGASLVWQIKGFLATLPRKSRPRAVPDDEDLLC